jgi:hypothetical protein
MAGGAHLAPACCPPAIAIHDYRDVNAALTIGDHEF